MFSVAEKLVRVHSKRFTAETGGRFSPFNINFDPRLSPTFTLWPAVCLTTAPLCWTASNLAYHSHPFSNKALFLAVVDPQRDWTPHRLEMCLWAMAVARQQQLPLLKGVHVKAGGAAEKSSDADASHRPIKKLKTKWRYMPHNIYIFLNSVSIFVVFLYTWK